MNVSEIMTTRVVTISMDDSVQTVRDTFERSGFHHLVVLDRRRVVGVISDRDLLQNLSPFVGRALAERTQDTATLNRRAHQIMTRHAVTVGPDTDIAVAAECLIENGISCLPVVREDQRLVGIVTWKDLLRWAVASLGSTTTTGPTTR